MKILYIGEPKTHELYIQGKVPSHWLYGAEEMAKSGHEVIWCQERSDKLNDISLLNRYKPDMIFIPNLNVGNHWLLLALSSIGIVRIPIYAYLHRTPSGLGIKGKLFKFLLNGVSHIFFLSNKTKEETIETGMVDRSRASLPGWGPDMDFYSGIKVEQGERYVSTGKENRDFDLLIEVFKATGLPLIIMTAKNHNGDDYSDLVDKCKDISNIEVVITENTGEVYPAMLEEMRKAKALVCPLNRNKMTYCVGLSTIADAIGLGKPLIITNNLYHDKELYEDMNQVSDMEDWKACIENDDLTPINSEVEMSSCYNNMAKQMNLL